MNNREQVPPEDRVTQNEIICEKLLGWIKRPSDIPGISFSGWCVPNGPDESTPSFTTWADAGLILEAWTAAGNDYDIDGTSHESGPRISARLRRIKGISYVGDFGGCAETAPIAVRAAALKYIRSLP